MTWPFTNPPARSRAVILSEVVGCEAHDNAVEGPLWCNRCKDAAGNSHHLPGRMPRACRTCACVIGILRLHGMFASRTSHFAQNDNSSWASKLRGSCVARTFLSAWGSQAGRFGDEVLAHVSKTARQAAASAEGHGFSHGVQIPLLTHAPQGRRPHRSAGRDRSVRPTQALPSYARLDSPFGCAHGRLGRLSPRVHGREARAYIVGETCASGLGILTSSRPLATAQTIIATKPEV